MGWLGGKERAGWEKAPPVVEQEIRAVWQEDEMPDEIRQAPGYHAFTLSIDSQAWVDSMSEVVDGGNAVYGKPRPAAPAYHRSLASSPPPQPAPLPPSSAWSYPAPRGNQPPPRPRRPIDELMPDIDGSPPPAAPPKPPARPRVLMPDIDGTSQAGSGANPPAAGGGTSHLRPTMPDIGDPTVVSGGGRTLPHRVLVPEIGAASTEQAAPPHKSTKSPMPDIGDKEDSAPPRPRPTMPEIG